MGVFVSAQYLFTITKKLPPPKIIASDTDLWRDGPVYSGSGKRCGAYPSPPKESGEFSDDFYRSISFPVLPYCPPARGRLHSDEREMYIFHNFGI